MNTKRTRLILLTLLMVALAIIFALPAAADPPAQDDDDLIAHGQYLTTIAGCIGCHSPATADGGIDEEHAFSGGREFDLGPLGKVYSKNLTPDPDTGLGEWTDEEIERAIRTGVSRDGLHLFPVMPYTYFNQLDARDVDAIIAYLRSLEPINNSVPREQILPPEALPQLPMTDGLVAPDPSDTAARGQYLFTALLACSDCHTPVNPETGLPQMDLFLSGGQPFEGPWGVIYGGNITPDPETGIASWTDEEIRRVITTGVKPEGRLAIVMPWPEYAAFSEEDLDAVVYYLRNDVEPVNRTVPAPALTDEFIIEVPVPEDSGSTGGGQVPVVGIVIGVVALLLGVLALLLFRANGKQESS